MGVLDGQAVKASVVNPAFINKNNPDQMPAQLDFTSSDPTFGTSIVNIQKNINALASFLGGVVNQASNYLPTWTSTNRGLSNDSVLSRIEAIDQAFDSVTGHTHDGSPGSGGPVHISLAGFGPQHANTFLVGPTGGSDATPTFRLPTVKDLNQMVTPGATGNILASNGTDWVSQTPAASGGGGGGSLVWVEDSNSAMPLVENHNRVYSFQSGLGQSLYATIRVPSTYAGAQIKLRMPFYSPDSTGSALLQTIATLIRTGTDAISSTTNQRTSTNSAVTLGSGTVNIPQAVVFDLTDSSGKINSVSVGAGDTIIVQLTRGTDTGASNLKALVYDTEGNFT